MSDPEAVTPRKPRMDDRPLHDVALAIWGCPAVLVAHDLKLFPLLAEQPPPCHGIIEEYHVYIRTATVHDAAAIAYVHVESWRTTYQGIVPDDFLARLSYEQREQFWRQILTEPGSHTIVYVAEDEPGKVIGFASGGPERRGAPLYTGELYAIYVLAQHQGQGVGRQLVISLAHRLLQEGMQAMLLWVLAENSARQFYERLGGQPVYEKPVTIGGVPFLEVAYGWQDIQTLIGPTAPQQLSKCNGPD